MASVTPQTGGESDPKQKAVMSVGGRMITVARIPLLSMHCAWLPCRRRRGLIALPSPTSRARATEHGEIGDG